MQFLGLIEQEIMEDEASASHEARCMSADGDQFGL
jgi:hypothetical protein